MGLPKLIVFDMDGVLIDVSRSYRETVRKAVRTFLRGSKGFDSLPDPLFPLADLARFKRTGGLNNDWELTSRVISLLLADRTNNIEITTSDEWTSHAEKLSRFDASTLARFLKVSSSPLMELYAQYGRRRDPFVSECFKGDIGTGNIIKQIFQEVYLGYDLFQAVYGIKSRFIQEEGLIHQESLLMEKPLLEELHHTHLLAIATGRPRVEADYPLDHFDVRKYFHLVVTLDDCIREEERLLNESGNRVSLSKPHPFMLDLIPNRIGKEFHGAYYLGDMPDDMLAARSSQTGYRGVGVSLCPDNLEDAEKELLAAGADHIIHHHSDLHHILH
jgi:HAD superfamily hydrolase (TIGR01548 family)